MAMKRRPVRDRLYEAIVVDANECWVWQKCTVHGYGKIDMPCKNSKKGYRPFLAHRVMYELEVGPIPDGLELDHLCRNPTCVNPAHLEPVTRRENVLRSQSFTADNARKTHCKHGHPLVPENLRYRPDRPTRRECLTCFWEGVRRRNAKKKEARRQAKSAA